MSKPTPKFTPERPGWKPAVESPEGVVVMTKIDDAKGVRNECMLRRRGRLWYFPDDSMYVYYTPTHFAILDDESAVIESERSKASRMREAAPEMYLELVKAIEHLELRTDDPIKPACNCTRCAAHRRISALLLRIDGPAEGGR
ncbi:MAG: hypothetical protein WAN65_00685 [Candidatus Sulfotelmatobacter sp.]